MGGGSMILPDDAVKKLQAILKKDYGQTVTNEQAQELGVSLLRITRVAVAVLARKA